MKIRVSVFDENNHYLHWLDISKPLAHGQMTNTDDLKVIIGSAVTDAMDSLRWRGKSPFGYAFKVMVEN